MDFFEALTRKRACRDFTDEPVSEEHVDRLLYAASWAPIASNRPYRHCILVDDPNVIQAIRQISPSLQPESPLLLVIYSDLELAHASVGKVGDRCTAVDAGASGENVLLAAAALGLGAQFTMISAMSGIRTILGLPSSCRVDLIIPIGHAERMLPPVSAEKPNRAQKVYRNQYGVE
ncbi:nitroreductase family protein [Elongatibacter sediminis]|uniref:Nitroreductase family protein n=1 Tax=Elongatibacter sediminis TaxID=3119006 RepID=A0AAW9RHW3_9GAMM